MSKTAIIIGAGPAGLTAAYELITKTDILPIIVEKENEVGGISKTIYYNGNRMDIGGHRFFSKSDVVMQWWKAILPIEDPQQKTKSTEGSFLIRNRLSRIFYLRKFFNYPISINVDTIRNLGLIRIARIFFSYVYIRLFPVKEVKSLEDFFINRFGNELYVTFFRDYTEKVWGIPCSNIAADWGAQRIKELSIGRALLHAAKSVFKSSHDLDQKDTDTSLIEKFLYPEFGPGQLWQRVAELIQSKGGKIIKNAEVVSLSSEGQQIYSLDYLDSGSQERVNLSGNYFFSTMPVKELITAMGTTVPQKIQSISNQLQYRDFITVGLLLNKLKINSNQKTNNGLIKDNWIYIQEKDVKIGRLQIFNNWSPSMVADQQKVWLGLEYFCNEHDELWNLSTTEFTQLAIHELESIGFIDAQEVIDSTVVKVKKTYPAYFGSYSEFNQIQNYTDQYENLFLIGRNGMHKYNNMDHSMLTAITAVQNIIDGRKDKENIWTVNTEEDYHEQK